MAMDEESKSSLNCDLLKNLSHKKRKALLKKLKRKEKRQALAKERDAHLEKEESLHCNSPSYEARKEHEETELQAAILAVEAESHRQRELWEWHEQRFMEQLKLKEEQEERERQQKAEIERKIKEEWEERQKKEKEEEEDRRQKKEQQYGASIEGISSVSGTYVIDELLRQARQAENKDSDWSNPLGPVNYGKERQQETCPFFSKVGACRFGERCSRAHPFPEESYTVMFSGMFRHFQLDQGLCEEYDTDIVLEYEDSEVYQKFREFYEDTLPEFRTVGNVTQFKVCCNYQPHLRGNVYVSYSRPECAGQALVLYNARWYESRQISGQLVDIPSWRRAICGLFGRGKCPKGKECNFLHVFKNPNGDFNMADRDMEAYTPRDNQPSNRGYRRSRSPERSHRSMSRSSRYSHRRSRSRERSYSSRSQYTHRRSRSKSRESTATHDQSKRSRTRNRSRSKDRASSYLRSRSRSKGKRSRSRSLERDSHKRSRKYGLKLERKRSHSKDRNERSRSTERNFSKVRKKSRSQERKNGGNEGHERHSSSNSEDEIENGTSNGKSRRRKSKHKKFKKHKHGDVNTVSVDNIENYENSFEEGEFVWVEKATKC